jgi:hypothetical protein
MLITTYTFLFIAIIKYHQQALLLYQDKKYWICMRMQKLAQ